MKEPLFPTKEACVSALKLLTKERFRFISHMLEVTGIPHRTWNEVCSRDQYPHLSFVVQFCKGVNVSIIEYVSLAMELDGLKIAHKGKAISKLSADALRLAKRYDQLTKRQRVAIQAMTDEQFDLLLRIQSIPEDKQKAVFAFLNGA